MRAPGFDVTEHTEHGEACSAPIPLSAIRQSGLFGLFDLSSARASPPRGAPAGRGWPRRRHAGGFGIAQQSAHPARCLHGAPDIRVLGILVEKQHDFAGRALPGKPVLQSPGAIAKYALAPGAADLNGVHHCRGRGLKYAPKSDHEDPKQIANTGGAHGEERQLPLTIANRF